MGQHAGILKLTDHATLNLTNGWLKVARRLENGRRLHHHRQREGALTTSDLLNSGTLRLTGAAGLKVSGTFTNTATLDNMTWSGSLPGGLVNLGTLLDRSLIVMTSCGLSGTHFTATIQGYTGHNYQLQSRGDLTSG